MSDLDEVGDWSRSNRAPWRECEWVGGVVVAGCRFEPLHVPVVPIEVSGECAAGCGSGSADVSPANKGSRSAGRHDLGGSYSEICDERQHAAHERVWSEVTRRVDKESGEVGCGPVEGSGRSVVGVGGWHEVS